MDNSCNYIVSSIDTVLEKKCVVVVILSFNLLCHKIRPNVVSCMKGALADSSTWYIIGGWREALSLTIYADNFLIASI